MTDYAFRTPTPDAAEQLSRACDIGVTVAQILIHRGFTEPDRVRDFLNPRLADLTQPDCMADRSAAAERLARAVTRHERILVFGDYDVDGTTSAVILGGVLEELGATVSVMIANRFEGGYGFSRQALERAFETHPGLIVTCDCGSSDHERLAEARRRGIDVIVIDHHLVPTEPLPAYAFLNPHRPECSFPYKGLASAGLAFSVAAAVRTACGVTLDLKRWLDLVALGTIADVAPLDGDNRRLVRAGLTALSRRDVRPGIAALKNLAKMGAGDRVTAMDVAFRLAPRLNAAGRLGDPSATLRVLRTRSVDEARRWARALEALNEERKTIEKGIHAEAIDQIRSVYGDQPRDGVVLFGEGWHRGVVGITAARIAEQFGTPCVVVATEGGLGHGSCRGPDGFPLYEAIAECASLLEVFGGHNAAAGLTVRTDKTEAFRAAFHDAVRRLSQRGLNLAPRWVDVCIDGGRFRLPRATDLALLEPLGERNAAPRVMADRARVEVAKVVGDGHLKLRVGVGDQSLSAFGFGLGSSAPSLGSHVRLIGQLQPDTWTGGEAVELRIDVVEGAEGLHCT